jgi:hypothetical protein
MRNNLSHALVDVIAESWQPIEYAGVDGGGLFGFLDLIEHCCREKPVRQIGTDTRVGNCLENEEERSFGCTARYSL